MPAAAEITEIIPGDYRVDGRGYRVEVSDQGLLVRYLRANGAPSSEVAAHVTGPNTVQPTGNGAGHAVRLHTLAAAPGRYRTTMRCRRCGQVAKHLIDGLGRDCWEQLHRGAA